jgi:hypothetical protein
MTDFCAAVADAADERGEPVDALTIRIKRVERSGSTWKVAEDRAVGGCDPIRSGYEHGAA